MPTTTSGLPAAINTLRLRPAASTTATTSTNNSRVKPPSNPAPKYATRQTLQNLLPSAEAGQIFIGLAGLILTILGIKWAEKSDNLSRWTDLIWQAKSDVVGIARNWLKGVHRSESTGLLLALRSLELPHVVTSVLESCNWLSILISLFFTITLIILGRLTYTLYFHPLSHFPGPWYAAISDIFLARTFVSGSGLRSVTALHEKYGDVFRIAPNELSFCSAAAWIDIYGQNKSKAVFTKDPAFYIADETIRAPHLVTITNIEEHALARKILSPAFSQKALLEQEYTVLKYADMLMVAMTEESRKGPLNMNNCYNWITFDVLGELAFGEAFGSVAARQTVEWISAVLKQVKFIGWDCALFRISPLLENMSGYLIPADVKKASLNHIAQSKAKILARMNRGEREKKDFCSYIFKIKEEMGLSDWHMTAYSNALIIAGSETTATAMSTLTYWLCRTPRVYDKLKEEVRSRFKTSSEINSLSATFPYLTAVIHEILRIFPPIPIGMQRITPKGGAMVSGVFVPEGTTVSVHSWSASRNERNFKDSKSFIPERWLGLDPNSTDTFSASQPFLLGTRGCIGVNMAWMEMRILIAKMVFHFDYELVDDNLDWVRDSPCFILWQKPDLWIKVIPRDVS